MSSSVRASIRQYAVISVRTVPRCERLVIAYPDEKTLRDLLAGPSIVSLGHRSREDAEASIHDYGTEAQPLQHRSTATLVAHSTRALKEIVCRHLRVKGRFSLGKAQSAICELLQQTFAAAVVVFYSKNALFAAIRALISF